MRKILTQIYKRKDAKAQGRNEICKFLFRIYLKNFAPLRLCVLALNFFLIFTACNYKQTDLRNYAPAETLVYLETNDLQKTLDSLTENETFQRLSSGKTDFSALAGVQLAVAVTGFETSEKQITDGQAILNFKPRFTAIAETNAWEFQAVSLAENQIGNFVNETYGGEVGLEITEKNGGKWFEWTAQDGRKVFALVENSLIFFGNDAAAIEKCLAAKRGETENLSKNSELSAAYDAAKNRLAFGYVSGDGIAQIANLAGVSAAIEASEDELPRKFIADILPQILRKSLREITWTAEKTEQGMTDNFRFRTNSEVSSVLKETIIPAKETQTGSAEYVPPDVFSLTRYNLENSQIAWRSLLLAAGNQTDEQSAKILIAFSDSFFAPFGIADGEMFLSSVYSEILTARFDAEGERQTAIIRVKDGEKLKKSLLEEFHKKSNEVQDGTEIWKSEDDDLTAAFTGDRLILGDSESVLKCLQAKRNGQNFTQTKFFKEFSESRAAFVTFGKDDDSAHRIVDVLGELKNKDLRTNAFYLTETRFAENTFERKTVSDFGLIGTILEQFAEN